MTRRFRSTTSSTSLTTIGVFEHAELTTRGWPTATASTTLLAPCVVTTRQPRPEPQIEDLSRVVSVLPRGRPTRFRSFPQPSCRPGPAGSTGRAWATGGVAPCGGSGPRRPGSPVRRRGPEPVRVPAPTTGPPTRGRCASPHSVRPRSCRSTRATGLPERFCAMRPASSSAPTDDRRGRGRSRACGTPTRSLPEVLIAAGTLLDAPRWTALGSATARLAPGHRDARRPPLGGPGRWMGTGGAHDQASTSSRSRWPRSPTPVPGPTTSPETSSGATRSSGAPPGSTATTTRRPRCTTPERRRVRRAGTVRAQREPGCRVDPRRCCRRCNRPSGSWSPPGEARPSSSSGMRRLRATTRPAAG